MNRLCEQGMALVIVLWVTALLAVIAGSYSLATRTETQLAQQHFEAAQARASVEAGLRIALMQLMSGHPEARAEIHWRADGTLYETTFGGSRLRIAIEDEAGKIDLNSAVPGLLDGLLASAGLDSRERAPILDAMLDWRDADSQRRRQGAEDADYVAARRPWNTGNSHFDRVEELASVLGMTPALYQRIAGALTVYSGEAGVNPRLASRAVLLAATWGDESAVDAFMRQREAGMGEVDTRPVGIAESFVSRRRGSEIFSVHVEARTPGGALETRTFVVRLTNQENGPFYEVLASR